MFSFKDQVVFHFVILVVVLAIGRSSAQQNATYTIKEELPSGSFIAELSQDLQIPHDAQPGDLKYG